MTSFINQNDYYSNNKMNNTIQPQQPAPPPQQIPLHSPQQHSIKKAKILFWLDSFKKKDQSIKNNNNNNNNSSPPPPPSSSPSSTSPTQTSIHNYHQSPHNSTNNINTLLNSLAHSNITNSTSSLNSSGGGNSINNSINVNNQPGDEDCDFNTSSSLSYSSSSCPSSPGCTSPNYPLNNSREREISTSTTNNNNNNNNNSNNNNNNGCSIGISGGSAVSLGTVLSNNIINNYNNSSPFDNLPPIPFPTCPNKVNNNNNNINNNNLFNTNNTNNTNNNNNKIVNRITSSITIGISKSNSFTANNNNTQNPNQNPNSPRNLTTSSTSTTSTIAKHPDRDTQAQTSTSSLYSSSPCPIIVPEMKATKENFYKTINDPKSFIKFKTYMENCQSMENLNFFLEIERYKKIEEEMERKFTAMDIWRRFFEEGGSNQLGLESAQKKYVEENKSSPTSSLFDEVQNQVLEDMVCDVYRHFLSSPFNQEWRVQPSLQSPQQQIPHSSSPPAQQPPSAPLSQSSIFNLNQPLNINQSTSTKSPTDTNSVSSTITPAISPQQQSQSFSISSPEHTELDVSDIQFILDEVVKNNLTVHHEIHYSDVSVSHWIASGASGRVYFGNWKGRDVAVKVFGHEFNVYFDEAEYKREVALMTLLKHDNLVQCYGSGSYGSSYFHLTEYCPKGSLTDYLKNPNNPLDLSTQLTFALDIAYGMKYLHSMSVIHRDLKSMNILLSENNKLKIIDFGSSRVFNKQMTWGVGTQLYMAPEVFTSKSYTEKVDVYSFGIILWEIFTRRAPYEENVPFNIPFKVAKGERPEIPKETPPYIATLIKKCWSHRPSHRPSFAKISAYLENNMLESYHQILQQQQQLQIQQQQLQLQQQQLQLQQQQLQLQQSSIPSLPISQQPTLKKKQITI